MGFEINHIEMKQERARALQDAQAIHLRAAEEKRDLTGEETQEFEKRLADAERFSEVLDRDAELRAKLAGSKAERAADAGERMGETATVEQRQRKIAETEEYRDAFDSYLRRGLGGMKEEQRTVLSQCEQRDMLTTSSTAGGYVVPQDFYDTVISAKVPAVAMRRTNARVINTSNGRDLPIPTQSAYGAAAYLAEGVAATETDDTGAKVTAKAYTAARMTKVSIQLLEDGAVDVAGLIGQNIGRAFAQFEDPEFLKGTGAGSSHITGATLNASPVQVAVGGTVLFTYADLVTYYFSVQPQYRNSPGAGFVLMDTAMATLLGLKDSSNRPIWTASQIPGEPDTLMGKPLVTSPNFATEAANSLFGLWGDFSNGYTIRQDGTLNVRRTDERFIDSLEVGFIAWERVDGVITDANAFKVWKHSAT